MLAAFTGFQVHASRVPTLVWNPNPEKNIAGYRIYYGEVNTPATILDVGKKTSRKFADLVPGKRYFFYVTARNTRGTESPPSESVFFTQPLLTPSAPSDFAGSALSSTRVRLEWKDTSKNEDGFRILRKAGVHGSYTMLSADANATTFTDVGLEPSTQYFYRALAFNDAGNSSEPPEISVTTEAAPTPVPIPTPTAKNTAVFVRTDALTAGDWRNSYGTAGVLAYAGRGLPVPKKVQINAHRNFGLVWNGFTSDRSALENDARGRFATAWHSSDDFYFFLQFKDTATHQVSFYFLDYEGAGRAQRIEFFDHATGKYLTGGYISNFEKGIYSTWNLKGKIRVRISRVRGANAVMSGLFFDPEGGAIPAVSPNAAHYIDSDPATGGAWKGRLGAEGLAIARETPDLPDNVALYISGAGNLLWDANTSDPAALERTRQNRRIASAWSADETFITSLRFTDTQFHRVALYCVDFDHAGRTQKIEVLDGVTGDVLDSTELSDFDSGVWLTYEMKGHVNLRITSVAGPNAVLSGIFFDPSSR